MKVLALDLATRTGWALGDGRTFESGYETFDLRRGDLVLSQTEVEDAFRLRSEEALRFARWILATFSEDR